MKIDSKISYLVASLATIIPFHVLFSNPRETVKQYVTDASINANVFLSFDNNTAGTVGIAWGGSVCADKTFRTSINEWFVSDAKTAEVFHL